MSKIQASLDHKRIRRLIWLVLTVFVLLGYSLQSVAGIAYYSNEMQNYATVSSPPVILQNGTAGTSTIYANNTSAKVSVEAPLFDYVDNNDPDVDSSADKGMHSNFPAQQAGPDSTYDTLTEENTEGIEDYVDNISDVDSSSDVGTHSNFNNMKFKDGNYDVVSEACGAIIYENSAESYSEIWQSSHSFDYSLQTASSNDRLVVVTVSAEDAQTGYATSVKFNNQEMKDVANLTVGTGYSEYVGLWYFLDSDLPSSTGNYSVSVTFSEAMEREIYIAVAEYTGVKQSVPDDYDTDSLTSSGSISVTLTAANDGSVVVAGAGQSGTNSWGNTNNIDNLQTQLLTSSGSALGHHTNVDSGDITVGWNNLDTRECMVGAVWQPAENEYGLDLEVQWTSVIDFLPAEKLCIYAGTLGAEDLNVDFWNGTGWENLATDLNAYSCNEVAVSLTSATFTIRFRDDTTVGDTTQDEWQIDASLLRVEGAGDKEDAVDNDTSDEDSSSDLGVLTDFTNMTTYDANMANLTETTGGVDGDWGDTNNPGGTSSPQTTARAMGGISPDLDNMTLTSISVWWGGTGTGRLAVYQGGALDNLTGATLVWDAGEVAIPETAGWVTISGGSASLTKNTPTWIAWKCNDASYYYETSWDSASDFQSGRGRAQLNDEGAASTDVWDATIGAFSFSNYWYDMYINYTVPANYQLDQEVQWTDVPYLLPNENLSIYGGNMGAEDLEVDVWNGTDWEIVFTDLSSGWNNASITNWLTTSNFTIRFKGGTETGDTNETTWQIDVALVHVWNEGGESYELDLEVQWTNTDYTRTNEELCIKTGTFSGSENIQVKVWNNTGSSWHWVMNLTANQWNNVSITSYLTSSTFTVQFSGGTETGDITQDNWNIDATLLHVWTSASNWLSGWDKRVKITIDHNDIDSGLSDFPVLVFLSNSSGRNNDDVTFVFDEVGSNRKKIAVTESDGTTQCYVEIEKWDDVSEQAWLWVKVPNTNSTADTDLYLYFDSSQSDNTAYVGDKESTPAQNVWNTNFKGVWHLDEDPSGTAPQMRDSTSNNNDGTSSGTMTSGDQVTGKIDGSLDFDGINDYIQTPSNELQTLENFTMSLWFKTDTTTNPHHILWEGPASENGWGDGSSPSSHEIHLTICKFDTNNTLNFFYGYEESGGNWEPAAEIITPFSDTTNWNHVVVVMTGAGTSPSAELFLNGVSQGTDTGTQTNRTAWNTNLRIGRPGADQRYFDGMIDEVRILETAKSASWIKASYESGIDDLLDFGAGASEDTSECTYDYVLRVNNTVTDSWQIRLKKYSDSNISRLQNCTIYFHNSTDGTSSQIDIQKGSYINQTGPWYDLGDSETIYIAMTVQANSAATSYVYAYLEIRTPNTTTYAEYVITFEIT